MITQYIRFLKLIFTLVLSMQAFAGQIDEKVTYTFIDEPIDVVIPTAAKDSDTLEHCISAIKRNCKNVGRIIVVSPRRLTKNAEWYNEADYPFSKYDVALYLNQLDPVSTSNYFNNPHSRLGWYYQQLLKLYAIYTIPNISSNVLIVDADTVFLRPTSFINSAGGGNYAFGDEYNIPYFEHMDRLLPGLCKLYPEKSGICHHMLFQKAILDDLFSQVSRWHGLEFWQAFCLCVDPIQVPSNGASEYEIYFNFAFARTDQVKLRPLKWKNSAELIKMAIHKKLGYDFVTYHEYLRR